MTPNKERIRLVVDALRSGDFHQGHGALEYMDKDGIVRNCCLGVACRVAMVNGLNLEVEQTDVPIDVTNGHKKVRFGNELNYLPDAVVEWLGLPGRDFELIFGVTLTNGISLNDVLRLNFDRIADAIKSAYLS